VGAARAVRDEVPGARAGTTEPGQPPDPSQPIGTDPAAADRAHRRADDGEPLLRQLPRHAARPRRGLPAGADGEPVVSNPGTTASPCPRTTCPPRSSIRNRPRRAGTRATCSGGTGPAGGSWPGNQEVLPDADPAISMGYWTEADIPFYYGLARTFPLADHWFSSCLGPRSPTAVSSSREPRTASSTTCRSTCSTTRPPGPSSTCSPARDLLGQLPLGTRDKHRARAMPITRAAWPGGGCSGWAGRCGP
jgi:hypothetical protein